MSDKNQSYTFQQITITTKFDGASKNVTPPILSWSNKTIYAGNGNYSDKFKDLVIDEQIVDSGDYNSSRGSKGRGGGGGRDYNDSTPQELILTIKSSAKKGTTYKCIANIPTIVKDKLALDDFVNALLDKHDRVLTKIDEENGGNSKLQHSKPGKRSGIGNNFNNRLSRTNRNSIRGASSATKKHTITPHANQQLNVYQKNVKRPSSGSFQSPGRPVNGADSKKGREDYTHYDPALEQGSSPDDQVKVKGNVVESPANKKLKFNLSDKSPRNATPSKLRNTGNDSDDFDDKLDMELDKRMGKKKKGKKVSLDPAEDDNGIVKRRRLQKMTNGRSNYGNEDEEDSDVEFDTEPYTKKERNIKKRLNLAINKNSEEQVTEDDGDNTDEDEDKGGEKEGGIAKNSLLNFGFGAKSSTAAAGGAAAKKEGSANNKKVRPSSPTPSDTYYGTALSTSTPVRPTKKQRAPMSTPPNQGTDCSKTPVQSSTQKKTSSKYFENNKKKSSEEGGGRKLFSGNENYDNKPPSSSQPSFAPYSGTGSDVEEEEDVLPGYGNDDDYYNDENAYHQEDDEFIDEPSSSYKSTYAMMNNRGRRSYGKSGSRGLLGNAARRIGDRLGRARLQQNRGHPPPSSFGNNRFDGFKAGGSPLVRNPYNRRGNSIADQALASKRPRYGSPPPDQTRKSNSFWQGFGNNNKNEQTSKVPNIPGIQNLGNTCYLSVSLQTLFSIPQFIVDLNKTYELQSSLGKKLPLTKALLEVATAINVLDEKDAPKDINPESARTRWLNKLAANPVALKKQMDVSTDKFVGYEQRDAHEFLSDLVDYLHDELAAPLPSEEGGEGKSEESKEGDKKGKATAVLPTDEYFHLNVRVCLECDNCKYSRSKDEMYRHLSVDIGEDKESEKPWSVEQSLQQFFQPEQRELKCEKCDEGKTATQKIEIISCPKALLLHFKRFIVSQEVKSGGDTGKENNKSDAPRMEMVLRKNKVRRFVYFVVWLDYLIHSSHTCLFLSLGKDPSRGVSVH